MDNFYSNCPPMMSDSRHLTDYRSSIRMNDYIRYVNNIWRDDDYRLFLQKNGKQIMDREWKYLKKNSSCFVNPCVHNYPTRVNNNQLIQEKIIYDSIFDKNTNEQLKAFRVCCQYDDYRLTP